MKRPLLALSIALIAVGCAAERFDEASTSDRGTHTDHDHHTMVWLDADDPTDAIETFERPEPFAQISLWLEGPTPVITAQVRDDGAWSDWMPVDITWSEADRHVGRLFASGDAVRFRGLESMSETGIEFFVEQRGRPDLLTRELPFARPDDSTSGAPNLTGAVAPASLVIPRSDWGARDPDRICGSVVSPYRMSIHHTALPDSDGGDPAARMRQMQAYHIDSNGWCDIGYHFVVSQSGNIYQGRSDERRPGTHVGGQNYGNVGISLIGNYTSVEPPAAQFQSTIEIVRWVSSTYDIPLDRDVIKGHREWPGQSTGCPGDRLLARLGEIVGDADEPEVVETDVDIDIWTETSGLEDLLVQGTSLGKPDAFPGDTFEVSIYVQNKGSGPIRDVELGYYIEEPYIRATDYVIETDAPEFDGSFMVNDADSAESNPAKDSMGAEGALTMYAFAAGETKRVRITLEALVPSIGRADHPDVRGWLRNVGGAYAQEGFADEPSLNNAGKILSAYSDHDVLTSGGWLFDSSEAEMLEGWVACSEGVSSATMDGERSAIRIETEGDDPCIVSPPWAEIDADRYNQLILQIESNSAPHRVALYWSQTDDETFTSDRGIAFEIPAEGGIFIVNVGQHPRWEGTIERLRLDPIEGEAIDTEVFVGALLFQSSDARSTTIPDFEFSPDEPISGDEDVDSPGTTAGGDDGSTLETNDGCSQAGAATPSGVLLLLMMGFTAIRRRG